MLHVASDFYFGEGFRMVAKITKAVQVSESCTPSIVAVSELVIVFTAHLVPKLVGSFTSLLGTCINY